MKRCPHCNSTYTNDALTYCLEDGIRLINADSAYAETLINPEISKLQDKIVNGNLVIIAAIVGLVAIIIAFILKTQEIVIYNVIFLATTFIVILIILAKSYLNTDKEQNPLYTLITDELLPNKTQKSLDIKTEIAIVEAKDSQSIYDSYRKEFKKVEGVRLTHIICDSSDTESQISSLTTKLKGVEAVVVVRTKELEETAWLYTAIQTWAIQHSHVPCLIIDKISPEEAGRLVLSQIPKKYYFIADDKISLPWRLLQRANERAFSWRNQARFSRLTAISIFILLLVGFMTNYSTTSLQRIEYENLLHAQSKGYEDQLYAQSNDYENLLQSIYYQRAKDYGTLQKIFMVVAKQTRDQYESSILHSKNEKLNVSYWYNYNGTLYQIGTTNMETANDNYQINESSIIGCSYLHSNSVVRWYYKEERPIVIPFNEEPSFTACGYGTLLVMKLKSVICATYNVTDPQNHRYTFGLCVFTESDNNVFNNASISFLKAKAKAFHDFVLESLKNGWLKPQPQ